MWKKKLKKKKLQFIVLALILAFAAMLLTTCLCFGVEVEQYTDARFARDKNCDLLLYTTKGTSEILTEAAKEREDIEDIHNYNGYHLETLDITHNGNLLMDYIKPYYALELDNYKNMSYQISIVSGDDTATGPKKGEVWIQKIVADSHNIHIGDVITLNSNNGQNEFTVTTLVNDNTKPSSITTGAFLYINKEDSVLFQSQKAIELISIISESDSTTLTDWAESLYTKDCYGLLKLPLSEMKLKATMMTSLISKLGSLCALFMFLITIVIVLFFIRNTILNEYGAIGTYKSVGFTTREIMGFYMKAYSAVGIGAIVVGSLIGLPVSIYIGNIVMEYIGKYELSSASIPRVIFVILFTSLLLLASIYLALRRIRRITPVDAFHMGTTSTKAKLKKSIIKNAHSSLSMAINDIFKYKNRSMLIVIIVAISFYIGIMLLNMCYVFNNMESNSTAWVGYPKAEFYLSKTNSAIDDALIDYVESSPYVESYIKGTGIHSLDLQVECEDPDINIKYANIMAYNTFDYDLTGIQYAKGRPPKNPLEVAIDATTLKDSNYEVGDRIELSVEGESKSYLICGIFNSMMSPSLSFVTDSFTDYPQETYYTSIGVNLKHSDDKKAFEDDFKKSMPDYNCNTMKDIVDNIKQSVMSIMVPVTMIIIVIFFSFTLLNITNLIIMNNNEQQQNFGIMKAFGFTNSYIIRRNVIRIVLLSILGTCLALLLNFLFNAKIFEEILTVDAYETQPLLTGLYLTGGILIIIIITLLLSLSIRRISPKKLMEQ